VFQVHVILHPTDFSDYSTYAFRIATDLARQHGATVLVLHVAETLGPANVTYGEAVSRLEPEGYRQRLLDDLRRTVPPPAGVAVEYLVAGGDPAEEIARVAADRGSNLIVMGTHGRTGLERLLMGSIAEKVVRLAPCPILITKLPKNESPSPAA